MNTKFTPGPWKLDWDDEFKVRSNSGDDGINSITIVVADCNLTAYIIGCNAVGDLQTIEQLKEWEKANAKLIAAAPEMFNALQAVLDYEKRGADKGEPRIGNGILSIINAAIKKATE